MGGCIFALDVILSAFYLINTWRRNWLLELAAEIKGRRKGERFESELGAYEFTPLPSCSPFTALLTRCKVMSALAATRLRGISLFRVGFFFSECWHYIESKSIRGPLSHIVMIVIAMGGGGGHSCFWTIGKPSTPTPSPANHPTPFIHAQPITECVRI